ncbi:MAG: endonuclease/exonuclease/phosphatase family protein [archaeon]
MKILSWNICVTNRRYRELIDHLFEQDADIMCLQEVTNNSLAYLTKSGLNVHSTRTATGKTEDKHVYKVILSKHKILRKGEFHTRNKDVKTPWETVLKAGFGLQSVDYIGQYIDLSDDLRIVNLHLESFVSPLIRLHEFAETIKHYDNGRTTIYCGDFNTYAIWYLNWIPLTLMKLKLKYLFFDENKEFHKLFTKHNLNNLFLRHNTVNFLKIFWRQVDHILVPNGIDVVSSGVDKNSFGSDHNMIFADIRISN